MENTRRAQWAKHYAIVREPQTWKNVLYLLMSFPLGIAYFVVTVVGLAAGIPLLIVWVGLIVLAVLLGLWWGLGLLERQLAIHLLGVEFVPTLHSSPGKTALEHVVDHLRSPKTWKTALYLFLKFPMGIAGFVLTTTLLSMSFAMVFAPLFYQSGEINIFFWEIDSLVEALIATGLGLYLTPFAFHILNGVTQLWGKFSAYMLGGSAPLTEKSPEDVLKTA